MNNPDPEDPYDDLSLYAYSRNNPLAYFDPDGRIPILIPIVAGLVGGGLNLAANWSKIKDPIQGLGYFASGAAGGVISLTNPLAGGAVTSAGNATIDIASGNIPDLHNPADAILYVGQQATLGAATSFAGAQLGKIAAPALNKLGNTISSWFKNSFQAYAKEAINTVIINGNPITTTIDVGIKATKQYGDKVLGNSAKAFANDAIKLTTSSKSTVPSRTYTIYNSKGQLHKFGVTDADLVRYSQSLKDAGPGAYGKFSSIMPKNQAHLMEKYLRSLHYNSTGQYILPGMKVPYPVNFNTGLPIKP